MVVSVSCVSVCLCKCAQDNAKRVFVYVCKINDKKNNTNRVFGMSTRVITTIISTNVRAGLRWALINECYEGSSKLAHYLPTTHHIPLTSLITYPPHTIYSSAHSSPPHHTPYTPAASLCGCSCVSCGSVALLHFPPASCHTVTVPISRSLSPSLSLSRLSFCSRANKQTHTHTHTHTH